MRLKNIVFLLLVGGLFTACGSSSGGKKSETPASNLVEELFPTSKTLEVKENQTENIQLFDVNNSSLRYSLTGKDSHLFSIDEKTGILKLKKESKNKENKALNFKTLNSYSFSVVVTNIISKATKTIPVVLKLVSASNGSNNAPTANAGADKTVQLNQTLSLTGSGTDSDGNISSYKWTKGSIVLATTATFSYTPTVVGTDTLTLTVTDDDGATASDIVDINVTAVPVIVVAPVAVANIAPVANAGTDKTVQVNQTLSLTGSGTDSDGNISSYKWSKGSTVLGTTATLSYTPSVVGTDTLTLTVTDDDGAIASDTVDITVTAVPVIVVAPVAVANIAPVANAGVDKSVQVNQIVSLIGSGTDSDGNISSYKWTKGSTLLGSTATLSYTPTVVGTDTLTLTVTDDDGATATDTVEVTVTAVPNVVPTANAGVDKSVEVNQILSLTGSGTDSDGTVASYKWTKGTTILGSTATLSYTPTVVGTDTLTLTVTDDDGATATDTVEVTVTAVPNVAPTANAGVDKSVEVNQILSLTGSGTDSDGNISSYEWKKGSTVLGTTATLSYTPTAVGTDVLTLEVTDNDGATSSDTVEIIVTASGTTTPTTNGLKAHFNFEGNLTIASDANIQSYTINSSGNGMTYTTGAVGQAMSFDGTNNSLDLKSMNALINESVSPNSFTLSYFVKTDDVSRYSHFATRVTCNDSRINFDMIESDSTTNLGFALLADGGHITAGTTITEDEWTLITVSKSKGNGSDLYSIYKNGVLTDSKSTGKSDFVGDLSFSNSPCIGQSNIKRFKGQLDDLRIYNRALSASEILVIYNQLSLPTNVLPTVNAGADKSVEVNHAVSLTGTATDSDGTISSYEWKRGSTVLATTAIFSYTPTAVGTDTLTLEVTDDDGDTSSDSVVITVTAVVAPTTNGLKAHFNFDGNVNIASDADVQSYTINSSGNGMTYTAGAVGQAMSFDGTNNSLDLKSMNALINGSVANNSFTLSYFVKTDDILRYSHFATRLTCSSSNINFDMIESDSTTNLGFALLANGSHITAGTTITKDEWTLITVTKSKGNSLDTYSIYKNGLLTGTETTNKSAFVGDLSFSNSPCIGQSAIKRFKGELDDLRIYDRALSASEILVIYNQL